MLTFAHMYNIIKMIPVHLQRISRLFFFVPSSATHCGMFRSALGKTVGFVGYTIQYGCIAHCAFEYIGELVSVSL